MLFEEYNAEKALEIKGQEEYEKGEKTGILKTLIGLVKDGILTLTDAAKRANMSVEDFERKAASLA